MALSKHDTRYPNMIQTIYHIEKAYTSTGLSPIGSNAPRVGIATVACSSKKQQHTAGFDREQLDSASPKTGPVIPYHEIAEILYKNLFFLFYQTFCT